MGLRERMGLAAVPPRPAPQPFPVELERETWHGRPPVGPSEDLNRILAVETRELAGQYTQADVDALEAELRLRPGERNFLGQTGCYCATFKPARQCPLHLKPDQAFALLEARRRGKLFAAMGVGKGKTLVDIALPFVMGVDTAALLLPAALVDKFINVDWRYYGGHWRLPNLVDGEFFVTGRPTLHVISYEKLSSQDGATLLTRIKPKLFILDEAHKVKNPDGPRRHRIQRAKDATKPKVAILSGTVAARGMRDAAHLAEWALGGDSPFPIKPPVVDEWGTALDPIVNDEEPAAAPGALVRLEALFPDFETHVEAEAKKLERKLNPNERARLAFRLRRNRTPGVVATTSSSFEGSLVIRKRVPKMPAEILPLIDKAKRGTRPDGETSKEKLQGFQWARQLACGFFHRWRFPRGEPEELIERWREARREWHRAIRTKLEHPREHLDTPGLLENAAKRFHDPQYRDSLSADEKINRRANGGHWEKLPVWNAPEYPAWAEIKDQVQPVTSTVWLDKGCPEMAPVPGADFLVRDAVKWIEENGPGVVWCEFPELGERIARAAKAPWYGGGDAASVAIQAEKGDRAVVASMHAHRDGKDLQFAFSKAYFTSPYADGGHWEQAIGRFHRQGQTADEVVIDVAQHTEDFEASFAKARERARFVAHTDGQDQKLLIASYDW